MLGFKNSSKRAYFFLFFFLLKKDNINYDTKTTQRKLFLIKTTDSFIINLFVTVFLDIQIYALLSKADSFFKGILIRSMVTHRRTLHLRSQGEKTPRAQSAAVTQSVGRTH